ncbi:unnamed protein product [Candidula unifasciata]|uniref:ubiquitinyl hydrolase 1 n=1 Tax=Candidula unifasciata TaxID=100452 RepID=A0A8S4A5D7_9EUPU|nr:unnamed protein product [Candidula unifasciata]
MPEKQSGLSSVRAMDSETFHFVSYVPIRGRLFELDGLKPHPIDHGPWEKGEDWTEKFRKVISDRLGSGGEPYHDIRFNLMAVVPDRRQLLEQKLATLRINFKIVTEALQQPTSILKTAPSVTTVASCSSVVFAADSQTVRPAPEINVNNYDPMKLRSSSASSTSSSKPSSFITTEVSQADTQPSSLADLSSVGLSSESKSEVQIKEDLEKIDESSGVKQEQMDTTEASCDPHMKLPVKVENCLESTSALPGSEGGGSNVADVTKPLSIETKFNTSPCAASSESTDTASEIGSVFSSPGSLNTSSCQSSPQFSDGNTTGGHPHKRKRRSSHAFTPKDLLDLLKNVENEIAICENHLKEENEKRKKYKIDACRRTHNYDQFIMTFLKMLAEQGLLGDLMEENMAIKKPGGTAVAAPKIAKKSLLKVSEKKKKARIKKRGKK